MRAFVAAFSGGEQPGAMRSQAERRIIDRMPGAVARHATDRSDRRWNARRAGPNYAVARRGAAYERRAGAHSTYKAFAPGTPQ
jgi:hypothetical protein